MAARAEADHRHADFQSAVWIPHVYSSPPRLPAIQDGARLI